MDFYLYNLFQIFSPYRLLQNIEYSSLSYTGDLRYLFCIYIYSLLLKGTEVLALYKMTHMGKILGKKYKSPREITGQEVVPP